MTMTTPQDPPAISTQFTQDSIDPAFRLPVATDHSPAQSPSLQQGPAARPPTAEGQQPDEKAKKKAATGPRLKKACDSCSKRKIKVSYKSLCLE